MFEVTGSVALRMATGLRSELFGGGGTQSQNQDFSQQAQGYSGEARASSSSNDWYTGDASYSSYSAAVGGAQTAESGTYGDSFTPQTSYGAQSFTSHGFDTPKVDEIGGMVGGAEDDYVEPPLLEELEINFAHIWTKTAAVMVPTRKIDPHILEDSDLAGPLVFFFIQGFCLLLVSSTAAGFLPLLKEAKTVASIHSAKEALLWLHLWNRDLDHSLLVRRAKPHEPEQVDRLLARPLRVWLWTSPHSASLRAFSGD